MLRSDLRKYNQLRGLSCELGIIEEAAGSAKLSFGSTMCIASIYNPSTPKYMRHEDYETCTLEVDVSFAGEVDNNSIALFDQSLTSLTNKEIKIKSYLKNIFSNTILLTKFPRLFILIKVLIINDDGAALAVACNACTIALLDSGMTYIQCILYLVLYLTMYTILDYT